MYKKYYELLAVDKTDIVFTEEDCDFFTKHNLLFYFYEKFPSGFKDTAIDYKTNLLMYKLAYNNIIKDLCLISNAFDNNGISFLVIKGIGISETYQAPFTRIMGDHDILVNPNDFDKAKNILIELGYLNKDSISSYKDISLCKEGSILIELHHALFDSTREGYVETFTKALWQNSIKLELKVGSISVPNPEMHFRYITLHMMKHLKVAGFGLRHLLDLKNFAIFHNINLENQIVFFEGIGYGVFYRAVVTICHYELLMDISNEQWLLNRNSRLITLLEEHIAEVGIFGNGSEKLRIEKHFDKYKTAVNNNNKMKIFLLSIFPNRKLLNGSYQYAINNKLLLPVAWTHRFFRLLFNNKVKIREKLFFFTRDEDYILDKDFMMKSLGIRDGK